MLLRSPLILASGSPRRKQLLGTFGIPFEVRIPDVEETSLLGESAEIFVQRLAREKACAIAESERDALVLGADTIVILSGDVLGKPDNELHALQMLRRLRGRTHTVLTGIAVVHSASQRIHAAVEATDVTFDDVTDEEIDAYVATGSPMDKAGAYGIQDDRGALFVSGVRGDFYNVMGLPLRKLYRILKSEFSDLLILDGTI